jgi:hypothetical protein
MMDRKRDRIPLPKRHDLSAALHARPLFRQHKLTTGEVCAGLREKDGDLNRKRDIALEILVETVEVAGHVLQQQWRWTDLTSGMTSCEERRVIVGVALFDSHPLVP